MIKTPEIHKKTWGREEWIVNNDLYCGKLLVIERGKYCSLHTHIIKDETFYVLKGSIKLETQSSSFVGTLNDDRQEFILSEGESFHVVPYLYHKFTGLREENVIIEFSTKHYESDSYRVEPSFPEYPVIYKCSQCSKEFTTSEYRLVCSCGSKQLVPIKLFLC